MSKDILSCGHAANATNGLGNPSCAICGTDEVADNQPSLTGRQARCCYCQRTEPSDADKLAFFEYRGEGSERALIQCKCGYFQVAHTPEVMAKNKSLKCTDFQPRGPFEFDSYYCGCRGWD